MIYPNTGQGHKYIELYSGGPSDTCLAGPKDKVKTTNVSVSVRVSVMLLVLVYKNALSLERETYVW